MELLSNKTELILLTLIVVVSGCADNTESGDVTVSQTEGVAIEGFSASPSEIFEGQLTTLELQLRNVGGSEAENVVARLFNRGFQGDGTWNIQGDGGSVDDLKNVYFGTLSGPDPQTDAPAISVPRTWNLEAPDLEVSQSNPYDFNARVFYQYSTTAGTDIQVMSNDRYNELGTSRSQPSLDNTGGPLQVEVRTRTPIVFTSTGQDTQPVPVRVVVTNEGSGTPFLQSAYEDESYDVSEEDLERVDIEIEAAGNSVSFDSNEATVQMVNGEGVNSFTMNVERVSSQDIQQTVPLSVNVDYGYYQDTSTSVTVNGREGTIGGDNSKDSSYDTSDTEDVSYEWTGQTSNGDPSGFLWDTAEGGSTVDEKCNWLYSNTDGNPWTEEDVGDVCSS